MADDDLAARLEAASAAAAEVLTLAGLFVAPATAAAVPPVVTRTPLPTASTASTAAALNPVTSAGVCECVEGGKVDGLPVTSSQATATVRVPTDQEEPLQIGTDPAGAAPTAIRARVFEATVSRSPFVFRTVRR